VFICRDEKDNMVLECCIAADADFLITGDKDLLEIEESVLRNVSSKLKIISPKGFLSAIS
jgi:predicted nucleic acid-binding protein